MVVVVVCVSLLVKGSVLSVRKSIGGELVSRRPPYRGWLRYACSVLEHSSRDVAYGTHVIGPGSRHVSTIKQMCRIK